MQQWFTLSDLSMEEALHDMPLFRDFAGLSWDSATPDESTILRFRHLLETHKLAEEILKIVTDLLVSKKLLLRTGTIVDATLIAAPSSTKNKTKSRDLEMHPTEERQPVVLRHEGPHWRGCRFWLGTHRTRYCCQCWRCRGSQQPCYMVTKVMNMEMLATKELTNARTCPCRRSSASCIEGAESAGR
jgi:IS5 family transposase